MNLKSIIRRPIITEKSINQAGLGEYTFAVDKQATKGQIKQAVEQFFGVDVKQIRTLKLKGKTKRVLKTRKKIKLSNWKKAVVRIKEGQKIDCFEVGGEK